LARVAVFDSGLGSLSVIRAIQRQTRCEIIYLADRRSFPYGKKTRAELDRIIRCTIARLREKFNPDYIVVASNTPSIILDIGSSKIFAVRPPIKEAQKISRTKSIAILATEAAVKSRSLSDFILREEIPKRAKIHKIGCSGLVGLVESGDFLSDKEKTERAVRSVLRERFERNDVDVATLSSTHLPFLRGYLEKQFPDVKFLDPAEDVAERISKKIKPSKKNTLRIYSTDAETFGNSLRRLGVKNRVVSL